MTKENLQNNSVSQIPASPQDNPKSDEQLLELSPLLAYYERSLECKKYELREPVLKAATWSLHDFLQETSHKSISHPQTLQEAFSMCDQCVQGSKDQVIRCPDSFLQTSDRGSFLSQIRARVASVTDLGLIILFEETEPPFRDSKTLTNSSGHALFLTGDLHLHPSVFDSQASVNINDLIQAVRVSQPGFCLPHLEDVGRASQILTRVIACLRAPDGCPWDREQTVESLRPFLIEEAYEALEAADDLISLKDPSGISFADELGDVLLQIVLNGQIAAEAQKFNFQTIVENLTEKMVRRHPHVFTLRPSTGESQKHSLVSTQLFKNEQHESTIKNASDVKDLWEKVKDHERKTSASRGDSSKEKSPNPTLLHKALKKKALPTLEFVCAVSKQASRLGFCWSNLTDVWKDVESEIIELREEIFGTSEKNWTKIEDELGDVIFALANVMVHLKNDHGAPDHLTFDHSARASALKFIARFKEMEMIYSEEQNQTLTESEARNLSLDSWNILWQKAKKRRYR